MKQTWIVDFVGQKGKVDYANYRLGEEMASFDKMYYKNADF